MSIETIADLKPDAKNARKRGPRAEGMIVASLHEVGAARSIVIDEAGNILAGNGTVQAAAEAGIERVQVVDADGETIVAVRRTGLSAKQKRRLALLDNRTGELAEWDTDILGGLHDDGLLDGLWNDNELTILTGNIPDPDDPNEQWAAAGMDPLSSDPRVYRTIGVYFAKPEDVDAFRELTGATITDLTKSIWFPKTPK